MRILDAFVPDNREFTEFKYILYKEKTTTSQYIRQKYKIDDMNIVQDENLTFLSGMKFSSHGDLL
jgi:hypothetical protein